MLDAIGTLVGLTCWFLFVVLPLGAVIYLLVTTRVDDDGSPMDYMLEEEDMLHMYSEEKKECSPE